MKEGIHPDNYRAVVFKDMSNEYAFLSKSAAETSETIQWEDGNEYPLVKVEVSHKSHPFYTGKGSVCGYSRTNRQVPSEVLQVQKGRRQRRREGRLNAALLIQKRLATASLFCAQ